MEKIGIDVHEVARQVCIRTEDGAVVEQRIATTREAFAKLLVEASTESEWVARCFEALGHEGARVGAARRVSRRAGTSGSARFRPVE